MSGEKTAAIFLANMMRDHLNQIKDIFEKIKEIDTDFVFHADEDDMKDACDKLDEVIDDVKYSIGRFGY